MTVADEIYIRKKISLYSEGEEMVSHTYSKEALVRAQKKYYDANADIKKVESKFKYKFDEEYQERKKQKMREYRYQHSAIIFVKYLFK